MGPRLRLAQKGGGGGGGGGMCLKKNSLNRKRSNRIHALLCLALGQSAITYTQNYGIIRKNIDIELMIV